MSVRDSFVERFGEKEANAIQAAAESHKNGVHDNPGSDPFKWAILICVGYECLGRFADYHGITTPEDDVKAWALEHGDLASHDGDVDFITLFTGAYSDWVVSSEPQP